MMMLLFESKLWLGAESNRRHADFQSAALPTELPSRDRRQSCGVSWGSHYAAIPLQGKAVYRPETLSRSQRFALNSAINCVGYICSYNRPHEEDRFHKRSARRNRAPTRKGCAAEGSSFAAASHGLTYDGARKRVLLFGGDPGGPPLADTWNWDGTLWTQLADTGPSGRQNLAMAFDPTASCVVLFGGASGSDLFADTWTWNGTEWTQVADTGPAARSGHALAYDDARKRLVLFGGGVAANPLGDTWEWDGTEWTQVQDVGPSTRCAHAMVFDPTASRVVLFGGAGASGAGLNDTWLWDGTDWTQAADTGPDPRAGSAMVAATTIVLFGGVNSIDPNLPQANRIIYGDSWRWDGKAWTKVQDIGPTPRWGHGMAFRSDTGRIVLFGGSSVFGPAEDPSLQGGRHA